MKRGMDAFSNDEVAALRIFIAFLGIAPFIYKHYKKEFLKYWLAFLGMGMFGNLLPAFLFTKAETGINSSLTGMLNSLTPLFTLLLGVLIFSLKTKLINVIGILIGFLGAVGLIMLGNDDKTNTNLYYSIYVMIATVFYALSVNIIKKHLGQINAITATVWAMSFIGPVAGIYLFTSTDFITDIKTKELALSSLGYTAILGILGTTISVIIFNVLVKNTSALFASSVTYLIPIVAMIWGILEGEKIQLFHFVCITIILMGVYLVNKKPNSTIKT